MSSPGNSVRSAKPRKALALRSVPSIASAADPFPAHTVVAHRNTVRMYHDQFRIRYPGKALPVSTPRRTGRLHHARSRVQITQIGLQVRRSC